MAKMTLIADLERQRDAIRDWLREEAPEAFHEQAHLDTQSPEQIYWNYGYQAALDDIIGLICAREGRTAGTSSH